MGRKESVILLGKQIVSLACALWISILQPSSAAQQAASGPSHDVYLSRAASGIEALQGWYNDATGLYKTTGWWNSANAITVLVDYARVSKSDRYNTVLSNSLRTAPKTNPGFLNKFYDDEGWWALAWIDAWDLTGKTEYLTAAESIFADMEHGWDTTCGGGIWWSKDRTYKNAIANELFLSVSAHLANRDAQRSSEYRAWANKEWLWFEKSGMINDSGLINDGLRISSGHTDSTTCVNNGKTAWSYNQGVILGGLSELARINADPSLRKSAERIADAAITKLVNAQGVMHDVCEPRCGADGVQFKGIFARNLAALYATDPHEEYLRFLETNAEAVWKLAQGPGRQFGQVWSGPFDQAGAGSQSSAVDVLVSAAALTGHKEQR